MTCRHRPCPPLPAAWVAVALVVCAGAAQAQASAPAAAVPPPAEAASAPTPRDGAQRVEITGGRAGDDEQRRQSTAAKIVIGREEIDKFGDATVGEVLRRLPGVTTPGAPGRGGPPRMRGLGNGYTQLLIDGQRIPPGFSLESLTPEQVERIEILRAPTAETGARAIAGTINIVTREGFRKRLNDLRLGLGIENGESTPGLFWTHNDAAGDLTYNVSGAVFRPWRASSSRTGTLTARPADGAVLEDSIEHATSTEQRRGLNLTSRLQWRLGEGGDQFSLMPSLFHSEGGGTRQQVVEQRIAPAEPGFDTAATDSRSRTTSLRLNTMWRQRLGPSRLELQGGLGGLESRSDSLRQDLRGSFGLPPRAVADSTRVNDRSANLTVKVSTLIGGRDDGADGHNLVTGVEAEALRRRERRSTLQDGLPVLGEFGDELGAASTRLAAYAQDEWALTPNWALHAGLRWEGITTRGDAGDAGDGAEGPAPRHRSSVWTPLVHLLWKPDAKRRDQVRLSLTRSYRAPGLAALIARPTLNQKHPVPGPNTPDAPDSAGNPALRPELATGIDLAFERYLDGGGVLSANLFHRRIADLMRRVITLETVSWSPGVDRWVARQQNVGGATTQGLELEAKFRLDQAVANAPPVELRSNLSLYRSRVDGVPGPDNRLDGQARASGNLGADYRLRGLPLTLGGNLNWVPATRTQLSATQVATVGRKRVVDAFALWTFSPTVGLRVTGSNLAPQDYLATNTFDLDALLRTSTATTSASYVNWQIRLELKL